MEIGTDMLILQRIILGSFFSFHIFNTASQIRSVKPVTRITDSSRNLVEKEIAHRWNKIQKIAKDSRCLKGLLIERKVIEIEHFLDDENLLINPFWSGYSMRAAQGSKLTIIDLACQLGNIYTIERVFQRAHRDCFIDIVESLLQQNSGNVLRCFLNNHKERAEVEKFYIWRIAIERESLRKKMPQASLVPKAVMWDQIVTLLFPDNMNAADENGDTLLHIAVYGHNTEAMEYLLRNNANVELLNKKGYAPIHCAFTDVKMLSCLYAHHANINFPDRNGDTCLNFADEVFFSSETTKKEEEEIGKSISFLVEKGAKREIKK